jgi:hypothetical protein
MLNAGVVDQDVDAAEFGGGVFHHGFDVGGLAHVGAVVADRTPAALPASAPRPRAARVAKAVEHMLAPWRARPCDA